jgi:hypothetical protein
MPDAVSQILNWLSGAWLWAKQAAIAAWPIVQAVLNSDFTKALAGAGMGAWAGAWAAQRIAARNAKFEAALTDVRNANSAVTFAIGVANALTGLKRQFVAPLARDFNALVERHNAYLDMAAEDPAIKPFRSDLDLKFVSPPETPVNELGDVLRANAGSDPAAWLIFQTLRQIIANIDKMLRDRNAVLEEMRTTPSERSDYMVAAYLGVKRSDGNTDSRHAAIMKELPRNVDDGLGFARVLAEHISARAKKEAEQFGKKAPPVRPADFSRADELDVYPDMEEYREQAARLRGEKVERGSVIAVPDIEGKAPELPEGPAVSL